ncbi:MAG: hypothetical protein ABSC41_09450 [Acidimicrobiales bacterium]
MAVDLLDAEPDSGVTDAPGGHRRRRWAIAALAVAVLAAAFGYLAGNEVQANTQFDQTHRSLAATQGRTHTVLSELSTVRRQLDALNGQVTVDSTALARDASQLQGVRKALTDAQVDVVHQTSTIGDLRICLGGVEQALNALAVADPDQAIDALDTVSSSCAQAVAANG